MMEVRGASRDAGLEERSPLENLRQHGVDKSLDLRPQTSNEVLLKRSDP
jgi:hypothetical protein